MSSIRKSKFAKWAFSVPVRVLLVSLLTLSVIHARSNPPLDQKKILASLEQNFGERAAKRGKAWFKLMQESKPLPEEDKLYKVNRFFGAANFRFVRDKSLWGQANYWASPVEFIGVNAGDCEDFAIAKYFTLRELGVSDEKLKITAVKSITRNQYHMVLAYFETPLTDPLILDNLPEGISSKGKIKRAKERPDLIPIYSFNASDLWLNKEKGRGVLSGHSKRIKHWRELRQRMANVQLNKPKSQMEF